MKLGAFMQRAIEEYYAGADPFGKQGDFITAPEISQMFGEMIGIWITDLWMQMGKPEINIIEFGPGRGTLMSDILRVISKSINVRTYLIENSQNLIETQKAALSAYDINWVNGLNDIENKNPSIIIGNEFLDALPIEQLMRTDKGWQMRMVEEGGYKWGDAEEELKTFLPPKTESNVVYEVSPERINLIKNCQTFLNRSNGAGLFIDYGYTKSHHGDTLQAVKNHEYVDVFKNAGQADITSHVDFDALARIIDLPKQINNQGLFLKNLGIEHRAGVLSQKKDVSADLNRLISAKEMGDLFKVLCFYKGENIKLAGF